jgi:hypothetical protein
MARPKKPSAKVSRTVCLHPTEMNALMTWVDSVRKVRPFPVAHPGEIVGELVENGQQTGYKPRALRSQTPAGKTEPRQASTPARGSLTSPRRVDGD